MNVNEKLVAAAKRAAKRISRAGTASYQSSLDEVARRVGRPTWSAFLADPVPVDDDAVEASAEPDFTTLHAGHHLHAVVRHGRRLAATGFVAVPRSWDDDEPLLRYRTADGTPWPIDARGLSIGALASSCRIEAQLGLRPGNYRPYSETTMPTVEGCLMRATIIRDHKDEDRLAVSASLDGSDPEELSLPRRPITTDAVEVEGREASRGEGVKLPRRTLRSRMQRLLHGENALRTRDLLQYGVISTEKGPVIGLDDKGARIRLSPGRTLAAFSPPGTGRMVGVTIPALLSDDATSYVVHDDGQLHSNTAAWRRTLGRVAVIRLDGNTQDSINPFGREWIPKNCILREHIDRLVDVIVPGDRRVARLITEVACRLIEDNGGTTLREIRDALGADRERPFAREAIGSLMTLVSPLGHAATSHSTIVPQMLYGDAHGRPLTLYIIRDPLSSGTRSVLASLIQQAIWTETIASGPGRTVEGRGRNGTLGVATIFHDFHRMPRIPAFTSALDYARDNRSSVIITGSTATSIRQRYGEDEGRMIEDWLTMRLVLQQSDAREIELLDPNGRTEPGQMANLGRFDSILISMGGDPIRMRLPVYFQDPQMSARSAIGDG